MSQKCNSITRKRNLNLILALFITAMVVAACSGADSTAPAQPQAPAEESVTDQDAMSDEAMQDEEMMAEDEEMSDEAMQDEEMMAEDEEMSDEAMAEDEEMMAEDEEMSDEAMQDEEMMAEDEEMSDEEEMAEDEEMSDEAMDDEAMADDEAMELPAWFETELTNVNTGESFRIADFQDKVVLVETMAVWCTNCLRQQREVQALHDLLGEQPNLVSVALDIDPNENNDILKAHTDKNDFDWVYAVASSEVSREIGQLYGGQFLNPPATPMLIIDRHGQAHTLPFGHKTAQSLQEALTPFLNEVAG